MYAIVRTGGKQYRVEEGRPLTVERLSAEEGATIELDDVLLIANNGDVTVGTPTIDGARVLATVEAQGRAKKILVFKYKSKVRTRKKTGHRQAFTRLTVQEILAPGQKPKAAEKPKRRSRKAKAEETPAEPEAIAAEAAPATEAPAVEAPAAEAAPVEAPAPKRRTRRKKTDEAPTEAPTAEAAAPEAEAATPDKPKRRTRRKAAEPKTGEASAEEKPKTARRRSAKPKKSEETE